MPEPRMTEDQLYQMQEVLEREDGRGGGGQGERKGKKTSKAISESQADNTRRALEITYREKIGEVVSRVLKQDDGRQELRHLDAYKEWLLRCVNGGKLLDDADIDMKRTLSSVHAGGQAAQKNESTVILTHTPSLMYVREGGSRHSHENEEEARRRLAKKLAEHLRGWRFILEKCRPGEVWTRIETELVGYF